MTVSYVAAAAAIERFKFSTGGAAPGTMFTQYIVHGGFQSLADRRRQHLLMSVRLDESQIDASIIADYISSRFFVHLVDNPYVFSDDLLNYIAGFMNGTPNAASNGLVFSQGNQPSQNIPAILTFVGQFIDHDLTLNAVNLLETQDGDVLTQATPLIDLDSVYGPRMDDTGGFRPIPMDGDRFVVVPIEGSDDGVDLLRKPGINMTTGLPELAALIGDKRNDENQIILQIHLLLIRLHNQFIDEGLSFDEAKLQTILHWQCFVATGYLPLITRDDERNEVLRRLTADPDTLLHRPRPDPDGNVRLMMPHEFAIGFRFGHSQLRDAYELRDDGIPIKLFDRSNEPATSLYDLRGGKALDPSHVIRWPFFLDGNRSNLIDAKVNQVVFNLPPSTIPDQDVGQLNLINRNLRRSKNLGLCAGEDLVKAYNDAYGSGIQELDVTLVDPEGTGLFTADGALRTPLWYYLLREAERDGTAGQLGRVGSLLVSEVLLAGIYHAEHSFLRTPDELRQIPIVTGAAGRVTLHDIASYVGIA